MPRSIGVVLVSLGVGIACAGVPIARESVACPPIDGSSFLPCQVDVPPQPLPGRVIPVYPGVLRNARIGGAVRVRYVVDSAGLPVAQTVEIVESAHSLFTTTVTGAVRASRFSPGAVGRRPVAVRYDEVFEFVPEGEATTPLHAMILRQDSTPGGIPRTAIGWPRPDSSAAAAFTPDELREVQRAALAGTVPDVPTTPGSDVVVCVSLRENSTNVADAEALVRTAAPGVRPTHPRDCPRTYASMFVQLDSLGRPIAPPPGWVDPHRLTVHRIQVWTRDDVVVEVDLWKGTSGRRHQCVVRREGGTWTSSCALVASLVS